MVKRFPNNPLITSADVKPSRPDFEVMCAFNCGATVYQEKTLLMIRVAERPIPEKGYLSTGVFDPSTGMIEVMRIKKSDPKLKSSDPRAFTYGGKVFLTSISHLRLASSDDGRRFTVAELPTILPDNEYETFGIEDPRITFIDGWFYVNYSSISPQGVTTSLARTKNFRTFEKMGIMFAPDNKDIAIFPEKIRSRYYAFHRPSTGGIGSPCMWVASSPNLIDWGRHEFVIGPRPGMWDCERVGCGAAPVKTREGWLELYHASDNHTRYCSGAVLLDLEKPWKVIARGQGPFLFPTTAYEKKGFMPNVIFHNGLVDRGNGVLDLYYGATDDKVCGATARVADILATLKRV